MEQSVVQNTMRPTLQIGQWDSQWFKTPPYFPDRSAMGANASSSSSLAGPAAAMERGYRRVLYFGAKFVFM